MVLRSINRARERSSPRAKVAAPGQASATVRQRDAIAIEERDGAVTFEVRVSPRAAREKVLGVHGGALKLSLSAPPVDGAANEALVAMLARALGVPRAAVALVRGERSRLKRVRVHGITAETVRALLPAREP
jgi:uncharacterized protein (TIGR00251 family)